MLKQMDRENPDMPPFEAMLPSHGEAARGLKPALAALSKDILEMKHLLETKPQNENGFARLKELAVNIKIGIETAKTELENYKAGNANASEIKTYGRVLDIAYSKINTFDISNAKNMNDAVEIARNNPTRSDKGKEYSFTETLEIFSIAFSEIESKIPKEEVKKTEPISMPNNKPIPYFAKTDLGTILGISNSIKNNSFACERFQKTLLLTASFEAKYNITLEKYEKNPGEYSQNKEMAEAYGKLLASAIGAIPTSAGSKANEKQEAALSGNLHMLIEKSKIGICSIDKKIAGEIIKELKKNYSEEVAQSIFGIMADRGLLGLSPNDIINPETFGKAIQTGTTKVWRKRKLVDVPKYVVEFDMSPETFKRGNAGGAESLSGIEKAVLRKNLRNYGFFETDLNDIIAGRKDGPGIVKQSQMKYWVNDDLDNWKPFDKEGNLKSMELSNLIWQRIPLAIPGAVIAAMYAAEKGLEIDLQLGSGDKVFDNAVALIAIGITETGLNPGIVSDAGARGIFQIMPDSGKVLIARNPELKTMLAQVKKKTRQDPMEFVLNSYYFAPRLAAAHLVEEQKAFDENEYRYAKDLRALAAGYNADKNKIMSVDWNKYEGKSLLPGETQAYVVMVSMFARALMKDQRFCEAVRAEMKRQGIEFAEAAR